jgi:hypothetical protein
MESALLITRVSEHLQSWTKPLRPFQLIWQSYWTLTKQTLSPPPPQFNVVNNAETTFGNIPWHKLNIELGERGFKNGNMIQHGVYYKNTRIFYRGKIVSTSYVQDSVGVSPLTGNESSSPTVASVRLSKQFVTQLLLMTSNFFLLAPPLMNY